MARDDDDFVEFATASSSRLLHAAYLLTGDRHQAEDAVQTVLARTYAAWSRVRRDDAFAYARAVLINYAKDRWRRPLREFSTDQVPETRVGEDFAEQVAQRQWLFAALGVLPPRERAVVVLRHYFDLPETEVARQLGIAVGTVKSMNARALGKVRVTTRQVSQLPRQRGHAIISEGRP